MSPRSRRNETSAIAVTGLRLRPTVNRFVTPSMRRAGMATTSLAGRVSSIGLAIFGCWISVAVTGVAPGLSCSKECDGHEESRGPRYVLRHQVGLTALKGSLGNASKKPGPIWPTARGSLVRRIDRLRLTRDGRRSPVVVATEWRDRAVDPEGHLHLGAASSIARTGRAICAPVGSLGRRRRQCQPRRMTLSARRQIPPNWPCRRRRSVADMRLTHQIPDHHAQPLGDLLGATLACATAVHGVERVRLDS